MSVFKNFDMTGRQSRFEEPPVYDYQRDDQYVPRNRPELANNPTRDYILHGNF